MNSYHYVTPNIARLLEKHGLKASGFFKQDHKHKEVLCPSISEAIDFLWERYGYFIEVTLQPSNTFFASINKIEKNKYCESKTVVVKHVTDGGNYTPEEAAILAIQHCLRYMVNKIINKKQQ